MTLTITDDDLPEVTIEAGTSPVTEGTAAVFTLTRAGVTAQALTVAVSVTQTGTVIETADDYTAPASAVFAAESATAGLTVETEGDDADEADGSVTATVTAASDAAYRVGTDSSAEVAVNDDDLPKVKLVLAPDTVAERDDPATPATDESVSVVTATVPLPAGTAFTVTVAATAVSPADADDFTVSGNTVLSFTAEATESTGLVTVTAVDNAAEDGDRSVTVSGAVSDTAVAVAPEDRTLAITDDEGLPKVTLVLTPDTVAEADDPETTEKNESVSVVTATLQKAHDAAFTVTVAGSPVGGYTLSGNTVLSFAAEATGSTGLVTVTAVDDDVDTVDKEVKVSGTVSVAATVVRPPNARTLSIADDDLPEVTIAAATSPVTEGTAAVFTLSRAGVIAQALTVAVSVTETGAVIETADDYTVPASAVFAAGSATAGLTVETEGDDTDEANGSVTATVTAAADAAYRLGTDSSAEVAVEDDDLPKVELVLAPETIAERDDTATPATNESLSVVTATVPLAAGTAFTVTVSASPTGGYTLSGNTVLTFAATATGSTGIVTVTAVDDSVDTVDKQVTVSGMVSDAAAAIAPDDVTLTIADDDLPKVELELSPQTIAERDDPATPATNESLSVVTATVPLAAGTAFTVTVAASPAGGYTLSGNTVLTFAAAATESTGAVTVTAEDDTVDTVDKQVKVSGTVSDTAVARAPDDVKLTITDDDLPEVTIAAGTSPVTEGTAAVFTLSRAGVTAQALTVAVSVTQTGAVIETADGYTAPASAVFAAGSATAGLTVETEGDDTDEVNGSVTATVTAAAEAAYRVGTPSSAEVEVDDDDLPQVALVLAPETVAERDDPETPATNESVSVVTATVPLPAGTAFTVTVAATAVSPADADDFTLSGNTVLSFTAEATGSTGLVTVTAVDNAAEDGDKSVTVSGAVSDTAVAVAPEDRTLAITDDEGLPQVTLVLTPETVTEADDPATTEKNESVSVVTATLQKAHEAAFTVTVAAAGVSPADADDFTVSWNTVLTFAAEATGSTGLVTVTAVDDSVDTVDKQVTVSGTVSVPATVVRPPNARTLSIADDDLPEVTIAAGTSPVTEGTAAVFTLTRAGVTAQALTVAVGVTETGAVIKTADDYTAPASAVFAAGSATAGLTVETEGDDTDEADGSLTATVTAASDAAYRVGTDSSAEVAVNDDDLPKVELVLAPETIAEQDDTATPDANESLSVVTATVPLAAGTAFTVTVSGSPAGGYTVSGNTVLTFAATATESTGIVTVTAVDDSVDTVDKQVTVSGTVSDAAAAIAPDDVTLTIADDDLPKVELELSPQTIAERDDPATTATNESVSVVTATVPLPAGTAFTVTVAAAAVSPADADDFTVSGNTVLSFTAEATESTGLVTVTAVDNAAEDGDQSVTVSGAVSDTAVAVAPEDRTLAITDDEGLPQVTLVLTPDTVAEADDPATTERNESVSVVTATLQKAHEAAFTVTVAAAGVSPADADDFTMSGNTVLSFAADATGSTGLVTVTAVDDDVDTVDKEVKVSGTVSVPATVVRPPHARTLSIADDDLPEVTIAAATSPVTEGTAAVFTLTRAGVIAQALTVAVSVTETGEVIKTSDGYTVPASAVFAAGSATAGLTVETEGDDTDEADGSVTATVTAASDAAYRLGTDSSAEVAVEDDDLPKVELVLAPETIAERDDTATPATNESLSVVTATVPLAAGTAFTVTVAASPTGGYTLSGNTVLTFAATATESTGIVTVTAEDDTVDTVDKQVTVSGMVSDAAAAIAPDDVTLTITDDDLPQVELELSPQTIAERDDTATPATNESLSVVTATVPRAAGTAFTVTVSASPAGGYTLSGNTVLTFAATATGSTGLVTVTAEDDTVDTVDKEVTVSGTVSDAAVARAPDGVTLTITDDDLPEVTIAAGTGPVTEGTAAVFTLTRAGVTAQALTVAVSVSQTGAVIKTSDGYTAPANAVFAANEAAARLTVETEGDDTDEVNGSITASVGTGDGYRVGTPSSAEVAVEDDDLPQVSLVLAPDTVAERDDPATTATDESVSVVTATVPLPAGTAFTVTVAASPAGGYTLSGNRRLTFTAEATGSTGLVTVTAVDNAAEDGDQSVTVSGAVSDTAVAVAPEGRTLTITDDEGLPKVTLVLTPETVAEADDPATTERNESVSVVTATLQKAHDAAFTVTVAAAGVSPADADDFTMSGNTVLSFAADATGSTGLVTVTAVDDDVDTVDKEVKVSGTVSVAATVVRPPNARTLSIDDDDLPEVTIEAATSPVTEGTAAVFTLSRAGVIAQALTVAVSVSETGAVIETAADYTAPASAVFAAGSATAGLTVETEGDDTDEANGSVTATVTAAADAAYRLGTDSSAEVAVEDDDLPKVELVLAPETIAERDDTATPDANESLSVVTATVPLAAGTAFTVTVSASPAGGYTVSGNTVLTFAATATEGTGIVTVTAVDDSVDTVDKEVTVSGTVSDAAVARAPDDVTLTIADDDLPKVELELSPQTIAERDDPATPATNESLSVVTATVPLAAGTAFTVTVAASPAGGYTLSGNTVLTFAAAATESTGAVTVTAEDDTVDTVDKQVKVSGTVSDTAVARAPDDVKLTITDDDLPEVTIAAGTSPVTEGTAAVFTLSRAGVTAQALTVAVSVTQTGAVIETADGYTAPASAVFAAGSATAGLTVETEGDDTDEVNGSVTATVTAAAEAAYRVGTPSSAEVEVDDDDLPQVALVLAPETVAERDDPETPATNESVSVVTATVPLPAGTAFTVTVAATAVSPADADDFTLSGNTVLSFTAEATGSTGLVTVTAVDNAAEDGDKSVTVSGAVSDTAVAVAPEDRTLAITDDEGLPQVTLVLTPETVTEADDPATTEKNESVSVVTATLQKAHEAAFTVTVAAAGVSPADADDFTVSWNTVLTFAAEATGSTGLVTVTAVDDSVDTVDKQVTVSGTVSVPATVVRPPNARTLSIADDDLPEVTIAAGTSPVTEGTAAVFTLSRAGVTAQALTVAVSVTETGEVIKTSDGYTVPASAVFAAGSATAGLTVETEGDDTDEADGSLTATVTAAADAAYRVGTDSSAEVAVDDDDLPKVELVLAPDVIAENGAVSTVRATVPLAAGTAFTVTVSASPAGGYTLSGNTVLTFAAEATGSTGAVTVTAVDNGLDEPDKQVTVSGTVSDAAAAIAPDDVTLTITDDDLPKVELELSPQTIAERDDPATPATNESLSVVTATVPRAAGTAFTVTVAASPAGGYTLSGNTVLTFAATATGSTGLVTVTAEDDTVDTVDKEVTVSGTVSDAAVARAPDGVTLTITDDDLPEVTIAAGTGPVTEGTAAVFTLTRAGVTAQALTVAVSVSQTGAVIKTSDGYTAPANAVFAANEAAARLTVETEGDDTDEVNGSITASVGTGDGYRVGTPSSAEVAVEDDDLPQVSLVLAPDTVAERDDPATTATDESVSVVTATVPLPAGTAFTVTVSASPAGGYTLSGNRRLTFTAEATGSTGLVTVTAVDNAAEDGDQSVTVSGAVSDTAVAVAPEGRTLTITDDEGLPKVTLVLTPETVAEADDPATTERNESVSVVTATLQKAHDAAFTVTVAAAGVSPADADDFTMSGNTVLSFAADATGSTGLVTVTAVDDDVDTVDKEVKVSGTVSVAATVVRPPNARTLSIDDDDLPEVTIEAATSPVTEGTAAVFTLSRAGVIAQALTVAVSVSETGAVIETAADYTAPASAVFAAGSATAGLTVETEGDDTDEANGSVTATVTAAADAAYRLGTDSSAEVAVEDDDLPKVELVLAPETIAERDDTATPDANESLSVVTATVPRAAGAAFTVTVSMSPAGGYTLSGNRVLTFAAAATGSTGTVTVTAVDDNVDTVDKQVTVSGTVSDAAVARAPDGVTLTITDDDLPEVTIAAGTSPVTEGTAAVFTLSRAGVTAQALTVAVSVSHTGAVIKTSDGYTAPTNAVFAAGSAAAGLTVETEGDDTDEVNGSITAAVGMGDGYRVGTPSSAQVTVNDDDRTRVTLVLTPDTIGENGAVSTVRATVPLATGTAFTVTVAATPTAPAVTGDYTLSGNRVLSIAADATTSTGAVTITAVDNDVDTVDKEVTVSGTVSNSAVALAPAGQTLTITDDDLPEVTIAAGTSPVTEGTAAVFTLTRAGVTAGPLTVAVAVAEDGAMIDGTKPQQAVFQSGAAAVRMTVATANDEVDEPDSDVTATVSAGNGYRVGTASAATVTITDDDERGVRVQPTSLAFTEGGTADYTVVLTSQPAATVTIAVTPATGSDADVGGNPSALTFGADNWNRRQTVRVSAGHDTDQQNDAATLQHTASGGDYAGYSVSSVQVRVYDDEGVPQAPEGLRVEAQHEDRVSLIWLTPGESGAGPVTGYRIEVSEDGVSWSDLVGNTRSQFAKYTHHGLRPGDTRHYRVSAINRAGTGPPSSTVRATTQWHALPVVSLELVADSVREGSPVELRLRRDRTAGTLRVEIWVDETGNMLNHPTPYPYGATFAPGASTTVLTIATVDDAEVEPASVFTANALARGRPYTMDPERRQVTMTLLDNDAAPVPLAPALRAEPGDGQVRLSWTPVADAGDGAILRFEYRHRYRNANNGWSRWTTASGGAAARSVTITGLENGRAYDLEVRAASDAGNGAVARRTVTVREPRLDVPEAPVVEATPRDGRLILRWAAAKDNGSPITHYERRYREAGGQWPEEWTQVSGGPAARGESMNGMTNGGMYDFEVRAVNGEGPGRIARLRVQATEPERRPGSPQQLEAVAAGAEEMRLSWAAPADAGHPALTGYRIERKRRGYLGLPWHAVMELASPEPTAWTDGGLAGGVTYHYRVAAVNEDGAGPWSEVAAAATQMPADGGICDRTAAVRDWIMVWLELQGRAYDCAAVTAADLKTVTHMPLRHRVYEDRETVVTALKAGDFAGLSSMRNLSIEGHGEFRTLPAGVFAGLAALETLELDDNALEALPSGVFDDLASLRRLSLRNNRLRSFPFPELERLPHLAKLSIGGNPGTPDKGVEVTPATVTVSPGGASSYRLRLTHYPNTTGITVTASSSDAAVTVAPGALSFMPDNWWRRQEVKVSASAAASGEVRLSHGYTDGFYTREQPPGVTVEVRGQSRTREAQAPRVAAAAITSGPGKNGTWDEGETVTAEVRFSSAVAVDTAGGVPTLAITLDGTRGEAVYDGGSGTPVLTFTRQVTEAEAGARKARVAANSLALNGGAIGADGLAAELGFAVAPYVSNVERVPDDSGDGRWTDGEAIRIRLSFNAPVTVNTANGIPSIRFRTGENARTAPYAQGSGTAVLVFAYPVAGADGTISSVAVSSGSIALNGGAIADAATGMAAELAHEGVGLSVPPPEVLPTLSVADAQTQEGQDATLDFAVTLSPAASDTVTVTWATADGTATAGADYTAADGTLTFAAGETAMTVTVTVLDDAVDEGEETLTLTLSDASGAVLADADATGTIVNSDPLPKAWLARFGRTVAGQVVEAVEGRLRVGAETRFTLGGYRVESGTSDPAPAEWEAARKRQRSEAELRLREYGLEGSQPDTDAPDFRAVTARELLLGSSFQLVAAAGAERSASARWTAWGRGVTSRFSGREGPLSLDGEVSTGLLGVDARWQRLMAGVAVAHSLGDGEFSMGTSRGRLEGTLTGVHPYARYDAGEGLTAWGMLGYGWGTLTYVDDGTAARAETDIENGMAGLGVRGVLFAAGGTELAVRADALMTWTRSAEAERELAAARAETSRVRLVLEGKRSFDLGPWGVLTPAVEVGVRHDGGDAERGTGTELGGSLAYTYPAWGLTVDMRVRGLAAHEDESYREWGAGGSVRMEPAGAGGGLRLSVEPSWGVASSGVEGLWGRQSTEGLAPQGRSSAADRQLAAEAGYGVEVPGVEGLVTPYLGLTAAKTGGPTYRAGVRWSTNSGSGLNLEGSRRVSGPSQGPEYTVQMNLAWKF